MITEDYVSFEIAKLLKEKGFNEICEYEYGVPNIDNGYILQRFFKPIKNSELIDDAYTAPTFQMARKWLMEVHNIYFSVVPHSYKEGKPFDYEFVYWHDDEYHTPYDEKHPTYHKLFGKTWKKYEEACDVAIKYFLENLI